MAMQASSYTKHFQSFCNHYLCFHQSMKRALLFLLRSAYNLFELLLLSFIVLAFYIGFVINISIPAPKDMTALELERTEIGPKQYRIGNNWAVLNDHKVWEIYVQGDAFERGAIYGKLIKEPVQLQEKFFVDQIEKIVPSSFYRFFLKVLIGYFNRDMDEYIPLEYQEEIYGVSFAFDDAYDYIAPKYYRILNYHAAHDIGHALKDYNMVGCTSFSLRNEFSSDSALLVARNFDFYVGDEFAGEKTLTFIEPDSGYNFASYSWAGFMGVVSGMNETGLCVTINAAKSDLPELTKTPISLLTREILQYASTIEEALEIAKKRETFVSETIMVTSAKDNRTALIEKSPQSVALYESENGKVLCTNHYQSDQFSKTESNKSNIENSDSKYRYDRLNELIGAQNAHDANSVVAILRNQQGKQNENLGMGNPKAINQLIAHHGIVFRPQEKQLWISTGPYQIGEFICYDLDEVFGNADTRNLSDQIYVDSLTIPADPFLATAEYKQFEYFKSVKKKLFDRFALNIPYELTNSEREKFISSNPESYITYMTLGQYYQALENFDEAKKQYQKALTKNVASKDEGNKIRTLIAECNE